VPELPLVVNTRKKSKVPRELKVPLEVSLDAVGRHTYVLEEIIDGFGNVIYLEHHPHTPSSSHKLPFLFHDPNTTTPNTKTTRSLSVLRRPSISFKHCGPGSPTPLLIGSEAPLTIAANEAAADEMDSPWDVEVVYRPFGGSDVEGEGGKRYKAWKKSLKTMKGKRELSLRASAPGEYTIVGVKGKVCFLGCACFVGVRSLIFGFYSGARGTCWRLRLVESSRNHVQVPRSSGRGYTNGNSSPKTTPSRSLLTTHTLSSGDTGVSASLVLHGTPPFQVYYLTQRDKETPRDLVKTFPNSRGELTLQPERSGHYVYTFVQMSDANYKKVGLDGPSIEQVVHPLAAAEFVGVGAGAGGGARNKRMVNSCSGNIVDAEVDLRVSGFPFLFYLRCFAY
jgi:nucleoporin POM152